MSKDPLGASEMTGDVGDGDGDHCSCTGGSCWCVGGERSVPLGGVAVLVLDEGSVVAPVRDETSVCAVSWDGALGGSAPAKKEASCSDSLSSSP